MTNENTEKNKLNFASIAYAVDGARKSGKESIAKDLVRFGDYNDFPDYLVNLYNNSSTHETCVNAIVEAVKGDGLTAEPPFVLDTANRMGESWNDVYGKVAKDYYLFGGFALEVIYNKARTKISEIYHVPFASVRSKEANHRGQCEYYYIARDWDTRGKYEVDLTKALEIPAYNPYKKDEQPSQLYYYKPYHPLQHYYPLPKYVGALKVIELDTEVDNFHVNNIKNGLAPSLSITTYTNASDDDRRAIENQLRLQYQGSSQAGQLLYMDVPDREMKPDIEPIPQNGADGYYTTINDMVVQKILTAHRITSPLLVGISQPGSLGNRNEMLDAYTLFLNMVIKPLQQDILAVFEEMLELKYPELDITIGVEQKQILDTGEMEVDVITSKDAESGEDAMLENEIEEQIDEATL